MANRVSRGQVYFFVPNGQDLMMPEHYTARSGQSVRVVKLPGAPPPGTMGQCHIEDARTKEFLGMVSIGSLHRSLAKVSGLEVRRVFLIDEEGEEGTMEDHVDVESYPLDRIPKDFEDFQSEIYGVYPMHDHDPNWSHIDSAEIFNSPEEAESEVNRLMGGRGRVEGGKRIKGTRFRRNPDDFNRDDGGSERRRNGPGGISVDEHGGILAEGPRGVEIYRLLTIRSGLKMEMSGLRMTRGVSCLKLAKEVTGLKAGTAAKMLPLYEKWLRERGILKDGGEGTVRGNPGGGETEKRNGLTLKQWMKKVDAITLGFCGMSIHDLPDMNFWDAWDAEVSPKEFFDEDVKPMMREEFGDLVDDL